MIKTHIGVLLQRKYMATLHNIKVSGNSWEEDKDGGEKMSEHTLRIQEG